MVRRPCDLNIIMAMMPGQHGLARKISKACTDKAEGRMGDSMTDSK